MPKTVREIMNPELFSLRPSDSTADALGYIAALGISGAPVLDEARRPLGVASFQDLVLPRADGKVAERMSVPALTVRADALIEDAARILAERGVHRVVVVDDEGRTVGIASSLDVISGLLGLPARHPDTFPHWDKVHGISWTDDTPLRAELLDVAPNGPGVLVLLSGGRGIPERVVWAESAYNVRTRLYDMLEGPAEDALLERILMDVSRLRFRAAAVPSHEQRQAIADSLQREVTRPPLPARQGPI